MEYQVRYFKGDGKGREENIENSKIARSYI